MFLVLLAQNIANTGTCPPGKSAPCPNTLSDLEKVFSNVISAAIPLAGILLFVFLLFAGVSYLSAGADPKKAESARNMATYAIMGVVALAVSYLVIRMIALFTGIAQLETFKIYQP